MTKKTTKKALAKETAMPSQPEIWKHYAPALEQNLESSRLLAKELYANPPQALLIEGGSQEERFSFALWISAYLNCQKKAENQGDYTQDPCLACHSCLSIGALLAADVHLFDGREGSIKVEDVRALRPFFSQAASLPYRMIIFAEAQALTSESANTLLKAMEDPLRQVCFLLLTPQRRQLLPTLVSRSWVLPLPCSKKQEQAAAFLEWEARLCNFVSGGQDFLNASNDKKDLGHAQVRQIILMIQRALIDVHNENANNRLAQIFSTCDAAKLLALSDLTQKAAHSCDMGVKASLVLENLAVQMFCALRKSE